MVDGSPIYSHQAVLAARSLYFETLFAHDFQETSQRVVHFSAAAEGLPPDAFMSMLRHLYADGPLKPEEASRHIYDLLSLADRFGVPAIKRKCEQVLAALICEENVCHVFKYANTFNCERLKETCLLFTEEHYQEVISSPGFEDLDKDEILKIIRMGK